METSYTIEDLELKFKEYLDNLPKDYPSDLLSKEFEFMESFINWLKEHR